MSKQKKHPQGTIAQNKKARHDYFIEHKFEAGMVLAGWEVKSLRAGKAQLVDSYVLLKNGEAWLIGCHIAPLTATSTHVMRGQWNKPPCLCMVIPLSSTYRHCNSHPLPMLRPLHLPTSLQSRLWKECHLHEPPCHPPPRRG